MRDVAAHALELVQIAEAGGFEIAWTPEHHTIEFTIAPNPFPILTHWAAHTKTIRLGTAVVVAPYWHPIRVAGEAALCDVMSNGRLEFGIGRGAYQYEFDRMAGGMPQERGVAYMQEMLPAVKGAVAGRLRASTASTGRFRRATSVPQARCRSRIRRSGSRRAIPAPSTGRSSTAPTSCRRRCRGPTPRCEILGEQLRRRRSRANPGVTRPRFLMLRRTCVYDEHGRLERAGRGLDRLRPAFREPVQEHRRGAQRLSRAGRLRRDRQPRRVRAATSSART